MLGYTVAVPRQRSSEETRRHRENVGDLVRRARDAAQMTQAGLGKLLGVDRKTIAKYEDGASAMPVDHLPILVKDLHIDLRVLAKPPEKVRYDRPVSDFLLTPEEVEEQLAIVLEAAASSLEDLEAEQAEHRAAAKQQAAKRGRRSA
jgi:transcriptional regulator with XRE-family HTH domain